MYEDENPLISLLLESLENKISTLIVNFETKSGKWTQTECCRTGHSAMLLLDVFEIILEEQKTF